ncbi:MAG: hypothetical protein O7F74_06620 [Bacteroidetes bacterium]|nr:hypothetical protein [Bacteroidota bacterium]
MDPSAPTGFDAPFPVSWMAGYGKQALVELVAFISIMNFSNFINNIAHTSIDFPLA